MLRPFSVCCVLLSSSVLALASSRPPTGANGVRVDSVTYSGNGCPNGTAAVALSLDAQAFTVSFSQFAAAVGPGVSPAENERTCQLHVKLTVPPGWSYALASVDYRGYAALDSSVTALRQSTYHITGESPEKSPSSTFRGAYEDDYFVRDLGAAAPTYWSACGKGKNLKIKTQLKIDNKTNPTGTGIFTVDVVDGEVYHLIWRNC